MFGWNVQIVRNLDFWDLLIVWSLSRTSKKVAKVGQPIRLPLFLGATIDGNGQPTFMTCDLINGFPGCLILLCNTLFFHLRDFTLNELSLSSEICFVTFPLGFCDGFSCGIGLFILVLFYCLLYSLLGFGDEWMGAQGFRFHFLLQW